MVSKITVFFMHYIRRKQIINLDFFLFDYSRNAPKVSGGAAAKSNVCERVPDSGHK